jgi:alkylation response protein AidB-like acyl-CoA dehydrogenase
MVSEADPHWEASFRAEVRTFADANLDESARRALLAGRRPRREELVDWQRRLDERGWAAPGWPVEHGGTGWSPYRRHVFEEELALAPAPPPMSYNVRMLGPVLIAAGSDEQKERFLARMRRLDDWWCQGFSEPGAGSDLAALRVAARREGDVYVVNGQKTWTSLAHWADWMFCLARTDRDVARGRDGISFLLIDMHSPGITVRPITLMNGEPEVCDVFFDDVEVPAENLVGEEGRGWQYANQLLASERVGIADLGHAKFLLRRLEALAAAAPGPERGPLAEDPVFRERLALVRADLAALEATQLRILRPDAPDVREQAAVLKLKGSELGQQIAEMLIDVAGPGLLPREPADDAFAAGPVYLYERATTIYGGSSEIQKDILALSLLGPRA